MRNALWMIAFSFLGLSSFANAGGIGTLACAGCHISQGASAHGASDSISFAAAKNTFDGGSKPTLRRLSGTWVLLGEVNAPDAPPQIEGNDIFDPSNGVRNSDNSLRAELWFSDTGSSKIRNLGRKNLDQTPSGVQIDDQASVARFAQKNYSDASSLNGHETNFECRTTDSKNMVCAMKLDLDLSDSTLTEEEKSWNGRVILYRSYYLPTRSELLRFSDTLF